MNFEPAAATMKTGIAASNEGDADAPILALDLRHVLFVIRRNLILIAGTLTIALLLGIVVTMLTTPRYTAVARLQIDQETDRILNESSAVRPEVSIQDAERFLQTQVDVISSRTMALRVARALNLLGNADFFAAMKAPQPKPSRNVPRALVLRDATLDLLADNMTVTLPRQSRVVAISFNSPDADLARRVANGFAREYITANLQRKFDSSDYARNFLSTELAQAKSRLEASERALNDYARHARLIRTGGEGTGDARGGSVTTASLVQLNAAAMAARADRIAVEGRWNAASRARGFDIPEVLANPAIQDLLQKRATAQSRLHEELARHLDDHPGVQQRRAEVAELDAQAQALAGQVRTSLKAQYTAARDRENALISQVNAFKSETLSEQDRGVQFGILSREADTNRALYDGLLQRFKEVRAAAGISTNNVSIVDTADVPIRPSSPRLVINLALALLLGSAAATMLVLMREQLDDRIGTPGDVAEKLGLPLVGTIPLLRKAEEVAAEATQPRSSLSEAYATLRTALQYATPTGLPRSLAVTSSSDGEGKSTASFALAVSFARLGSRVILVGGDLRRPSVHTFFDLPNDRGLTNLLTSTADPNAFVLATGYPNLFVLPSGPQPPVPPDLLGSERMEEVLASLSGAFDLVIVDAPPVLGLADAPLICAQVEGTLFLVQSTHGSSKAVKAAASRLTANGSRVIGVVLSKFDTRRTSPDYSYYGSKYYSHGSSRDAEEALADA